MGFFICFFVIATISMPLIIVSAARLFGRNEENVIFPDKFITGAGVFFLIASLGIMIFEFICYFTGGFDEIFAYSFGLVAFAFGVIFVFAGFSKKIIAGQVLVIKPLLFPTRQFEWKDIDIVKIYNGLVFPYKKSMEKMKIYVRGKKVLTINAEYHNYKFLLNVLQKNNVTIDDYRKRKRKKQNLEDKMSLLISPSILSGNFANLGEEVKKIEAAGADLVHCDVMDGIFVPNITFGMKMIADIKKCTRLPLDVHLMITEPERYIGQFIKAGADYLAFHIEATDKTDANIDLIKSSGVKAGIAVHPDTPIEKAFEYLDKVDFVVVMGVNPGFGGQGYIPATTDRIRALKTEIRRRGLNVLIEMDGGLVAGNARDIILSGMDIAVSGSAFFAAENPAGYVELLRKVAQ